MPGYGDSKAKNLARKFWNKHKHSIARFDGPQKLTFLMQLLDQVLKDARYLINSHERGYIVNVVYSFICEHDMYPSHQWVKDFEYWPCQFGRDAIRNYFPWMDV